MALGDGKAKEEVEDIKQELALMYDAITSLGDKLIDSFQTAVDEAGNISSAFEVASKSFQRGLAADLRQSIKNTDTLIDLQSKLGSGLITQKDIAKEQTRIAENRNRLEIKRKSLGDAITQQQKEYFILQESELDNQQQIIDRIKQQNNEQQKNKSLTTLILENSKGIADKIDKSGTLSKVLSGNFKDTFTFVRLLEVGLVQLVASALKLDKGTADVAKSLGISYHEAQSMNKEFIEVAKNSNNIFVTTAGVQKAQMQLSKAFGTNKMLSAEMLQTQVELTHQLGLSEETSSGIAKIGLLTGKSSKEIAANVMGQSMAMNASNKTALNEKTILEEVAKLSSSIQLSMANNPIELAKAVQTAKQFGMELSQVDGIAGSLLNFEDSISKELSAELLLGKDINLEKARQAALNNDLATVAEEIAKQAGSAADFAKMNRIQQDAIAGAVGMSREDLAKSLQDREVIAKLGAKEGTALEQYNKLKKEGLSQDQIAAKLGDDRLASSLHAESIQERFAASLEKAKELFVQLADAILPVVEPIADAVGFMASLISKSMGFLKVLGSIAIAFKTIQFLGNQQYRTTLLTNAAQKLGLITSTQQGLVEKANFQTGNKSLMTEKIQEFYKKRSLGFAIKENFQKKFGNELSLKGLGNTIKESFIKTKDFLLEKASLGLTLAKNAATLIYNGILSIGNAIKKSGLLASIADMAMSAFASLSKIPFIGPILGIAGAAAAAGLGYMYYNKADDMVSPGANSAGYGSRTLMGPEGAIALNNKDTVIAGTNLFTKGDDVVSKPAGAVNMVQDNSRMEKLLERAVNRPDPVIKMNGERLGTAVGKYAYSAQ